MWRSFSFVQYTYELITKIQASKNLTRFYMECNTGFNTSILRFSSQKGLHFEVLTF